MRQIRNIIEKFSGKNVLVIGDIMADKYIWGDVERISPEAPIQIVKVRRETMTPGGAANLANNVAAMGGKVVLVGCLGDDYIGKQLVSVFKDNKIDDATVVNKDKPTVTKTRVFGQNQQLMRLDYEDETDISKDLEQKLLDKIKKHIKKADLVAISDYQKGTLTENILQGVIQLAKKEGKMVVADTKAQSYKSYRGVDLITPNHYEAKKMTGLKGDSEADILAMGQLISSRINANVLITRASEGMSLYQKGGKLINIPTEAKEVYDVSGAGDTVVAAASLALATSASYEDAAMIANQAAALQVGKLGTAIVNQRELLRRFDAEESKIRDSKEVLQVVSDLKKNNKKVVFTSGCFDLLHPGHIKYLKKASEQGDFLIVGLNTDDSIKRIKGANRPVVSETQRAEMISFLDFVDLVTFFGEDTPEQILDLLKPDIFVKGGDYSLEDLPEAKVVEANGGKITIVPLVKGFSSSKIIDKIVDNHKVVQKVKN